MFFFFNLVLFQSYDIYDDVLCFQKCLTYIIIYDSTEYVNLYLFVWCFILIINLNHLNLKFFCILFSRVLITECPPNL